MADTELSFAHLGLDSRLLQATCELGWRQPTPIQAEAIPLALEGRDLLARAKTGSGKTGAYALPLLQRLLRAKAGPTVTEQAVRGLILVPTKELGQQVLQVLRQLTAYCSRDLRAVDVSGHADMAAQRPILMEKPDVVVGTPSRVLAHLQAQTLTLRDSLEVLVMDEADLLFSFGFEEDLKSLLWCVCSGFQSVGQGGSGGLRCSPYDLLGDAWWAQECGAQPAFGLAPRALSFLRDSGFSSSHLPKIYQSFLMSATFNEDVQALKELVLHNPVRDGVTLKLQEAQLPDSSQLSQFQIRCETEEDKFLLLYALLKLSLVRGKVLLFVSSIGRCYRLKLFLEQFSIPACVLNSELPVQSRCHIISQFNRGFYSYIIATDEQDLAGPEEPREGRKKRRKGAKAAGRGRDQEYGVSRGVDFQNVSAVINFDLPPSAESYIHRAGRTARADNPGTALTFVLHSEREQLAAVETALTGESDESPLRPYQFRMEEIEGLRYRCQVPGLALGAPEWDAMRSVTKQAIKEARLREIKEELLTSEKLKTYFEDNPRDRDLLRHDQPLHPAIVKPHLRNVPEYLVPPTLRAVAQPLLNKRQRRKPPISTQGRQNPLRSFKYTRQKRRVPAKGKAAA
ncbi:hypothetical protein lerEdw1_019873 [Lerista edwardsae]|nr:hypothetical protein lerEdw1_019873 [Lerista edwardsae]